VLSREFPHRRIGRVRGHGPPTARSSYVDVFVQQHPALALPAGPWAFHRSDRHCGRRRGLAFSVFGATATARMSKQASAAAPPQSQAWVNEPRQFVAGPRLYVLDEVQLHHPLSGNLSQFSLQPLDDRTTRTMRLIACGHQVLQHVAQSG
jgi:hypothetical protein